MHHRGFRNAYGDLPVNRLTRQNARDIIGAKADTPHAANLLKVLRVLFEYVVTIEMIEATPSLASSRTRPRVAASIAGAKARLRNSRRGIPSVRGCGWRSPSRSGCSAHRIAAITGHASLREVEHCTKAAEQKRLA